MAQRVLKNEGREREEVGLLSKYKIERLNALKEQFETSSVFSWSKIDTFKTDKWLYYLKYVSKVPADNKTGAYAVMGSIAHDQLQKFYEEDITNQEMVDNFD